MTKFWFLPQRYSVSSSELFFFTRGFANCLSLPPLSPSSPSISPSLVPLGHAEEAQLPYFDLIPSDPTLEAVQRVVVEEGRRPSLPNPWNQHEVYKYICTSPLAVLLAMTTVSSRLGASFFA